MYAAEELVERAVTAAERTLAQRLGQRGLRAVLWTLRLVWMLTVLAYFAFGLTVLLTRYYVLPHIDDWRTNIESATSAALHTHVGLGPIQADWQGLRPRLLLSDVLLTDASGATVLALQRVEVVVAWSSLITLQPRTHSLTIVAPQVEVRRLRDHRFAIAGILIDPQAAQTDTAFLDWVLDQHEIHVREARVHFVDELSPATLGVAPVEPPASAPAPAMSQSAPAQGAQFDFTDVDLHLHRGLTGHRFALQLRPPPQFAGPVDLRGAFAHPWNEPTARMASWSGRIFLQFDYVDLARIDALTHLVPAPARIERASGALRAWIDFSELQLRRLRADVALTDVAAQLRPDLQPLRLDNVQGRITQTLRSDESGDTQEIALTGLQLDGPEGLRLPSTDLLFRNTRLRHTDENAATEHSRFEASRIVLSNWSRLAAQVPLPVEWLATIERTAARGTLEDLRATWDGPQTPPRVFSLHARFSELGFSVDLPPASPPAEQPAAGAPAPDGGDRAPEERRYEFANLAGSIDLDQDSGSLGIDAKKAQVRLAFLYDDSPVALDALATRVRWSHAADGSLKVDVESFSAVNEDVDLAVSGAFRTAGAAPARLDVNGRFSRAKVGAVSRYLPTVVPASARSWLHGALVDGRVTGGNFYLHGDPKHFPFTDPKQGDFHVAVRVLDGKLDIVPAPPTTEGTHSVKWPLLTGIDADVVFDRDRLTINGHHAKADGYDLSAITAQIPQLDAPDERLLIDGQGSGSLGEALHYVGDSPVNAWTGGWLASTQGSGAARLQLKLDIPLARPHETTVAGRVHFQGNTLILRADLAPFFATSGELRFTQRGVQFSGITAGFLGGEILLNGDTLADGTVLIQGKGNATPAGIKQRQVTATAMRHLLDHMRGILQYEGKVTVRDGDFGWEVDSDLVGLASDLPEPFRKSASEPRHLHLERVPLADAAPLRDTLRASLDSALTIEVHRVRGANDLLQVERGLIAIGASANVPDSGLLLFVDQPNLDVDRWQRLLSAGARAAPTMPEQEVAASAGAGQPPAQEAPGAYGLEDIDRVAVHAGTLTLDAKTITNVTLSAKREPDQIWLVDIDSDQATGSLRWVGARAGSPGRLTARLAKLAIPERDQKQVTRLLETPPTEFPALDIVADDFELGPNKFGQLQVQAQNVGAAGADTWHLENLKISNPDGTLVAHGDWEREANLPGRRMSLHVDLVYDNAGGLLDRFGLPGTIRNGKGKLNADLAWHGSPFSIDYPSLTGKMRMTTEKGQFLKASAGVGRLLGVLSLQSLFHRLTGDFCDVFCEGFAFDSLSASASIDNGTLTTDDFIMKGVNAVVRIKGTADLNAETQALQVVVIPEINAGTASLAYALINPAIGLGTFLANILLRKPLSAAFTNVYEVTGSWSDPKVERVKAASGTNGSRPAS